MKRSRRGKGRQHLPKVGTQDEIREEQHLEREAVLGNFGIHPGSGTGKVWSWVAGIVVVILVVLAVVALASL